MRTWLLAMLATVGCGDNLVAPPDAPPHVFVDAAPSFGARMPQAIVGDPTAIMTAPKGMAITWDNDPNQVDLEKFFGAYGASPAWAEQTAEYGVGTLTNAPPQHIAGNAPATVLESTLLGLLTTNTAGANPPWGPPDENTIYMFFIPKGTKFDDGSGSFACQGYDGYHFDTMINGVDVAYSISAVCHQEALGLGITDLQDVTITAGHEAVETATDPRTSTSAPIGWGDVDDAHAVWGYITEGELGDLCEYAATEAWESPPSLDYSVQRTWSNAAAAAGHDPCVGDGTTPYYQTIPDQLDTATINYTGTPRPTHGTKIAKGATGTIDLEVYADAPGAGPFTVTLVDDSEAFGGTALLQFTQPTGTYMPGDKLHVPVKVLGLDSSLDGGEAFEVDTTPVSGGGPATAYYGLVVQ